MNRPAFTAAARRMFDDLGPNKQQALIMLAAALAAPDVSRNARALYTDAQWAAKQNAERRARRERQQRQRDFAYGLHKLHGNPWESKAPRGWRPSAIEARTAAEVFAR